MPLGPNTVLNLKRDDKCPHIFHMSQPLPLIKIGGCRDDYWSGKEGNNVAIKFNASLATLSLIINLTVVRKEMAIIVVAVSFLMLVHSKYK